LQAFGVHEFVCAWACSRGDMQSLLLSCLVASLWTCGQSVVVNPTASASGVCNTSVASGSNGGRPSYHSPSATETYLPDCSAPLRREYWRVFAQNSTSAYMIPRPEGWMRKKWLCDGNGADLAALVNKYGMCAGVVSASVINDMLPADALEIAHALHQHLRFESLCTAGQKQCRISPFAPDEDILAACTSLGSTNTASSYCTGVKNRCDSNGVCTEIALFPSKAAADALSQELNTLYGISGEVISTARKSVLWHGSVASVGLGFAISLQA